MSELVEHFFGYLIISAITFVLFFIGAVIFSIKAGILELILAAGGFGLVFYALFRGVVFKPH